MNESVFNGALMEVFHGTCRGKIDRKKRRKRTALAQLEKTNIFSRSLLKDWLESMWLMAERTEPRVYDPQGGVHFLSFFRAINL